MRARECATLTIPTLLPPEGATQTTNLPTPWQSTGARCVNNLAAKLLLSLFPPNAPFFRLVVDDMILKQLGASKGDAEKALSTIERAVMTEVETTAARPALNEVLKHLIVSGNSLLFTGPDNKLRSFPLSNYVVKRGPGGKVLQIVVKEMISPLELPESIRAAASKTDSASKNSTEDTLELYTGVRWDGRRYKVTQEVNGVAVPDAAGTFLEDKLPFLALRWTAVDGEDYGRGMVEQYLGDFRSLEGLQQALVEGAAAAARVLLMVRPNSTTNKKDVSNAPSGSVISGNKDDVTVLQLEKYADFRFALETRNEIIQALSFAFMLNTAIQRNGERVTAEEIRFMANELEASLGGVYSTLSQELQLPLVTIYMATMAADKRLPNLPKRIAKPAITTGIEALGRGNDAARMKQFVESFASLDPSVQQRIFARINESELIKRQAASAQIDTEGLIKSDEEMQAEMQQQQLMQMAQQVAPDVVKGAIASHQQPQGA
jgi:hypothetical protein